MAKETYIYHHLGLGDHIICNGLVRSIIDSAAYADLYLFCKPHNYMSVSFMYRDLPRLHVVKAIDADIPVRFADSNIITVGHQHYTPSAAYSFDESFYNQFGFPFKDRWDKFYVKRDIWRERDLANRLKCSLPQKEYVFLHDDPARNLIIDRKHIINKELPIVEPKDLVTENIFDYLTIMEDAAEVHCMDSSFKLMFDSCALPTVDGEYYFHINLKDGVIKDPSTFSKSKLPWTII